MYIDRFDALKAAHLRETKKNPNCTTLTSLDLKDAFINGLQPRFLKEMILQANPATLKDAKRLAKAKEDNESSGEEETQSSDEEDVTTEKVTRSTRKKSDGHKINEKEKTVAQASTKTKSDNSELQDSMKQLVESFQTLTLFVQTQMNNNNGQRTVKEKTCYNCQNSGHDAKQCTSSCKVCQGQLGNHVYWDCLRYRTKNAQGTQQSFLILSSENSDEEGYNAEVEENYAAEKRNQSSSQSELDRKSRSGKRVRVRENIPKIHRTMRKAPATESNKGNRQVTRIIPMEGVEANVVPVVPEKATIRTNDQEKRIQIRTSVGESPKTAMNSTSQEDLDNGILPGDKIDPADVRHAKVYRCSLAQFENSVTGFRTGLRKLSVKKQTNPRRKQTYQPAHYHAVTREPDESNKTKKKGAPRTEVIVACTILTDAVLDGGSQSTIISLELVKALGIKELLPSRKIHGMADGSDARALGVVPDLTISVQDVIITTRAVVFDHHVYTLLIGMVLPANKNLVPNKAIDGANSNFLQTKKSWAQLLVGPNKTSSYGVQSSTSPNSRSTDAVSENLPSSTSSPSILPSFNQPFIKGTVAGSVFLDITPVKDKHLFFQELRQACNDNEHLWSFEDKVKRAGQKLFAEILLSPSMRQTICSTGVHLPSLLTKLIGYPSLSPDADILQTTFTNLPRQYGRLNGGLEQLRSDMIHVVSTQLAK